MSGPSEILSSFCAHLPKVEVHAHINGSIEEHTIKQLIEKKRTREPDWKSPCNLHFELGELRSLPEVFSLFKLTQELCDNEESAYTITSDVICDFANDNVKYLELRTTPRDQSTFNWNDEKVLFGVGHQGHKGKYQKTWKIYNFVEKEGSLDIIVKLLVSVDRRGSLDYAWETLRLAEEMRGTYDDIVVGLDLSGDPHKGDATIFAPVFKEAKEKGFRLSLHLAEIRGQNEECRELLQLPPDRIGHGTFMHPSLGGTEEILQLLDEHHTPFEVCLSSNVCTRTSASYAEHHFRKWYERSHPVVIATDDKGVFSTSLSKEYSIVAETFGLSKMDLWNLSYKSIDYIFANESVKDILRKKWNMVKNELLLEHSDDT